MKPYQRIKNLIDGLIEEGSGLVCGNVENARSYSIDLVAFTAWKARCKLLLNLLGDRGKLWQPELGNNDNADGFSVQYGIGALKGIQHAAADGLLLEIEDLILADAFVNLSEQADYLLESGFFLAAGVIYRAVLEERLRRMCDANGVIPSKARPTVNDFNMALYTNKLYDKIAMTSITSLASIGNDAAHNEPTLTKEKIEDLRDGLRRFLERFSS